MRRRFEWIVISQQRQQESDDRQNLSASGIINLGHVPCEPLGVEKRRHRHRFIGLTIDHHGHAHAAIGVAAAGDLSPLRVGPVHDVCPIGKRAHKRNRKPVAHRLAEVGLIFHVVREV